MGKTADGRQWITTVTLRPHVVSTGQSGRLPQRSRRSTMPRTRPATLRIPSAAKKGQVVGVRPDVASETELWRLPKGTPDVSSPLLADGLVYLCGEQGNLICLDAKSGQVQYDERLHSAKYRASPVFVDGKILCVARDGVVSVVQPGKSFRLLSENRMNDDVTASPAISGGRLYLRRWKNLYAIANAN